MKKIITILTLTTAVISTCALTALHSKADMKTETASFSVSADRSRRPSAYCRKSDGSPIENEYSSSDNFCIPGSAMGNMNMLSYDGLPAYCIGKHWQYSPVSLTEVTRLSDITYDSDKYGAIFRIAAAGASTGTTEYGLSEDDLYYVTQCAERCWLYDINPYDLAFFNDDGSINQEMTNEFIRITSAATEEPEIFETRLEIDDSDAYTEKIFTDNSCFYRYGPYHPYSDYTDIENYSVSVLNDDNRIIVSPFDDIINSDSVFDYSSDSAFYVYVNALYQEEVSLEILSYTVTTDYSPTVYLASDENYQDIFQILITDTEKSLYGSLSLQNSDTIGDLQLNKKFFAGEKEIMNDELTIQPRFTVKNENGKYVSGIQTDGLIVFDHFSDEPVEYSLTPTLEIYISGLPVGDYTIYEAKGAEGYEAAESEIMIENTIELNTCEFINISVTTTETTVTTTETTIITEITSPSESETTSANTEEYTFTLPSETIFLTDITEVYETETITSETTSSEITTENSIETPVTYTSSKKSSSTRISSSPKTGDTFPAGLFVTLITVTAAAAVSFRKFK